MGTRLDSFTIDEPWHIVAGASYVRTGDFRLNPEQPPLVKLWVGHASLLLAIGLLCWRAFGLPWAVGMLAFLAIDPTIGAHLPVVMMDLALGLTLILAALGIAIGLALGSKHSALAGLAGLGLLSVLWAQYGFHFHAGSDGSDKFNMPMPEKDAFYLSTMKPGGLPVYYDYPVIRRQAGRAGLPLQRRVESLRDDNVKGIYDGWFVKGMRANMPWPSAEYDPAEALRGLRPVARFGQMEV